MTWREMSIISWVGLRGAVPIILATYPLVASVPRADLMFNLLFFVVLSSVMVQGPLLPVVARWLEVDAPLEHPTRYPLEWKQSTKLDSDLTEVIIPRGSRAAGRKILELGLPERALVSTAAGASSCRGALP